MGKEEGKKGKEEEECEETAEVEEEGLSERRGK